MLRRLAAALGSLLLFSTPALAETGPSEAAKNAPEAGPSEAAKNAPDTTQAGPSPETKKDAPPAGQPGTPPHTNAGFGNEAFYLRSDDDNFIFIPSGRLQLDFFGFRAPGQGRQPFNGFFPRRARLEAGGTFLQHFDYWIGTELTNAAGPNTTDVWINANYSHFANVQLGQFDAPFTMSNRTSDKYTDMIERSRVVAGFALPENKFLGAMVFGQPEDKFAYWSLGVFNPEGQNAFKKTSNTFALIGRGWFSPGAFVRNDRLKNAWLGASYFDGFYNPSLANQTDFRTLSDYGTVSYFTPSYGTTHAGLFGERRMEGVELNAPVGPIVAKAEYVHVDEGLREISLATAGKPAFVRNARIVGNGVYGRLSFFAWGDPLINGQGGMQNPAHLFGALKPGNLKTALQLVVNWDHINFGYTPEDGAPRSVDPLAARYVLDIYGVGANFWATKHVRFTGDFFLNRYGGTAFENATGTPIPGLQNSWEFLFRTALAI